ncbi:transmembrane protein 238 [Gouania willdenowi]|uniref:transmembrane protein 238 n=1 Tax=Gouania willdenowi TaxID=441366 RepID=UPI001055769B|nr:transmembrane protein 238-like [Gouania willdenowi]
MEEPDHRGLGRCRCCFWLAVSFDVLGLSVLLLGLFVSVSFYDLLIYAGAIIIFLSLVWWVFWYSGNIEVPLAELQDDVGLLKKNHSGVTGAVRRLSSRLSASLRGSVRRSGAAPRTPAAAAHSRQVTVCMATLTPGEGGCDPQMPHTATEGSPT